MSDEFIRPKCLELRCNNVSEKYIKSGKVYYRKVCSSHRKYPVKKLKKNICSKCNWIGPTDIHRIIPGAKGGRYVDGNVIEICPNCHRLEHGKLKAEMN